MSTFVAPSIEELQKNFPAYIIESFIAQGGMGAVYLARQKSLDRKVAIKILPAEFGGDASYRASFETEAKAMARLNHHNLVGIYDFGDIDGMLYIIMEYIPGRSLFDTAHGQAVDQKEAASLIMEMCDGLEHAHQAGMIHRDIKPANVLIDDEARPKIVDFGLAKPLGEKQTEGVVFGTPGYTANEVLSDPHSVDHRSDIFSVGVMLYELLTGQLPGPVTQPASVLSGSDPRFDLIIKKAIHPNPAMRYKSAGEMRDALKDLLDQFDASPAASSARPNMLVGKPIGGTVGARSPQLMPVVKKNTSSGGKIWLIVGLVGAIIAAVMIVGKNDHNSAADTAAHKDAAKKTAVANAKAKKRKRAEQQRLQAEREKAEQERERIRLQELEKEKIAEEKERERELAEEKRAEEQARAQREAEELAKAQKEAEEEKRIAQQKAQDLADLEEFIAQQTDHCSSQIEELHDAQVEQTGPVFDKLERALKKIVRRWDKGKKAREARKKIEEYMEEIREAGEIDAEPKDIPGKIKGKVKKEIDAAKDEIKDLTKKNNEVIQELREDYKKALLQKREELRKSDNEPALELIENELKILKDNKTFLEALKKKSE